MALVPGRPHCPSYPKAKPSPSSPATVSGRQVSCLCASSFMAHWQSTVYTVHLCDQDRSSWLTGHMAASRLASLPRSSGHPLLWRHAQDAAFQSHHLQKPLLDLLGSPAGLRTSHSSERPWGGDQYCLSSSSCLGAWCQCPEGLLPWMKRRPCTSLWVPLGPFSDAAWGQ